MPISVGLIWWQLEWMWHRTLDAEPSYLQIAWSCNGAAPTVRQPETIRIQKSIISAVITKHSNKIRIHMQVPMESIALYTYHMVWKLYMKFNLMVSGRTVKLKSMKLDGNLLHCYDIEHKTRLHKIKIRQHFIQRIKRQTVKSCYHKIFVPYGRLDKCLLYNNNYALVNSASKFTCKNLCPAFVCIWWKQIQWIGRNSVDS